MNDSISLINDDVFELRFSDLPVDMDEIISDIITEEFEDKQKQKHTNTIIAGGVDHNMHSASVSASVSVSDDDDDGSTRKNNNGAARAASAMTVSNDDKGQPSILSMRTSLMSPAMADKFLEGFMKESSIKSSINPAGSGSGSPIHRPKNRCGPRTARTANSRTITSRNTGTTPSETVGVEAGGQQQQQPQPQPISTPQTITSNDRDKLLLSSSTSSSSSSLLSNNNMRYSISTDPLPMNTTSNPARRFSITANPALFGGGGTPIDINDISCSSMRFSLQQDPSMQSLLFGTTTTTTTNIQPPQQQSQSQSQSQPQSMRFSVSRKAVSLFDQPFDEFEYDDEENNYIENVQAAEKPVGVVSTELAGTYGNETENIKQVQEEALAKEMDLLSLTDKANINFDVHGITPQTQMLDDGGSGSSNISNKQDNIDYYLHQLDEELRTNCNNINNNDNYNYNNDTTDADTVTATAFLEAQRINPSYVNSKEFRLIFLRRYLETSTNTYDVQKAAQKILLHFQTKKMIFDSTGTDSRPNEILGRDVRLSDLSVDDRIAMDSGAFQIMQNRDTAGRAIILYAPQQRIFQTIENWMKAQWYLMWQVAKDVENSIDNIGICIIVYFRGWLDDNDNDTVKRDTFEQAQKCTLVREAIPNRLVALHYCYQDESMKALMTAQKVHFLTRNLRSRFRDHFSIDHNEICFQLETYGIPIDKQILLPNGHLGMKWYNEWIQIRESQEAEAFKSGDDDNSTTIIDDTIITPRNFDVLFGRGRDTREHCGNLRCAHLVEMHQQEYEQCTKTEKTELAKRIVSMVKECNGRFLKKDRKKGWQKVSDGKAREKVSHFFRHLRATTTSTTTATTTQESSSNNNDSSDATTHTNEKRSQHPTTEDDLDRDIAKHIKHVPV